MAAAAAFRYRVRGAGWTGILGLTHTMRLEIGTLQRIRVPLLCPSPELAKDTDPVMF